MQPKYLTDLQTRINESMSSIRAIKGDKFADATQCLFKGTHMQTNLNILLMQSDIEESLSAKVMHQINVCLASHMSLIVCFGDFKESDVLEMMNWVNVMHKHVHTAIEEAS